VDGDPRRRDLTIGDEGGVANAFLIAPGAGGTVAASDDLTAFAGPVPGGCTLDADTQVLTCPALAVAVLAGPGNDDVLLQVAGSADGAARLMSYERADGLPLNHRPEVEQFLRASSTGSLQRHRARREPPTRLDCRFGR
jgi:hypothetical protein